MGKNTSGTKATKKWEVNIELYRESVRTDKNRPKKINTRKANTDKDD